MCDLREGLTVYDASARQIMYERAFRYYCRCACIRIVVILIMAVVGLTGIVFDTINPTVLSHFMFIASVLVLFLQLITLPDGTVHDKKGNVIDLYSGEFILNMGPVEVCGVEERTP